MKKNPLIITMVAVIIFSFAATPVANANPLLVVALPLAGVVTVFGYFASEVHDKNLNEPIYNAYYIYDSAENTFVAKFDTKTNL